MNYPLQLLTNMGVVPAVTFPADSRYNGSTTLSYISAAGQSVTYLARRFVPEPGAPNYTTVSRHMVKQGDRLDLVAANYLGDPLLFWLICDANGAIRPDELVETPGKLLNITMPQGVPGPGNA